MITPKEIAKLAAVCRKSGIKNFSCPEFSFELGDEPIVVKRALKQTQNQAPEQHAEKTFESDEPTEMDLLLYSAGGFSEIVSPQGS